MYFDSHVHSAVSPDSDMPPQDAIAALRKLGLGVAFTEHVDLSKAENPDLAESDAPRGVGDFVCDFARYPQEYAQFRGVDVALGLEIGLAKAVLSENRRLAAGDYDFIIGSVHAMDGVEIWHAINGKVQEDEFMRRLADAPRSVIVRYLTYSREVSECEPFFDAFGHIDYIARYHPALRKHFSYENFAEEFDALLAVLVEREIALEINTYLFGGYGESVLPRIFRRFAQLGGRFCTIGSDAHDVCALARHFGEARKIADATGLTVVHYKERKPIRCG